MSSAWKATAVNASAYFFIRSSGIPADADQHRSHRTGRKAVSLAGKNPEAGIHAIYSTDYGCGTSREDISRPVHMGDVVIGNAGGSGADVVACGNMGE